MVCALKQYSTGCSPATTKNHRHSIRLEGSAARRPLHRMWGRIPHAKAACPEGMREHLEGSFAMSTKKVSLAREFPRHSAQVVDPAMAAAPGSKLTSLVKTFTHVDVERS